jgi:PAS domain S-box-containing protein
VQQKGAGPGDGTGSGTDMAAGNEKPEETNFGTVHGESSMRDSAEEQLARIPKRSADLKGQSPEQLIHELQVHQIELETQAEELRRAQLELAESRDKFLDLFEFAPLGYLTLNGRALVTGANLTAATLLGIERSTLIRAPFSKFMSESDADSWHRYFADLLKLGEKQSCTLVLTRGDGPAFPARLEGVRLSGIDGATTVRIVISDITDIRETEEALRLANRKLTLLSSITRHDINNQLLTLNGFIGLLHEGDPDPAHEHVFTRIITAIDQITAMIRFTKEYEQIGVAAPVWQDCRTLVDTAVQQVPPGKVRMRNDLPAGTDVLADPMVGKVCYTFLDNAVRHGGKITTIRFSHEERYGSHVVVCEDDGDGIDAEEKEKIFDRGFGRNTGLGLTLAREILAITGITIRETGVPGKGARFEMTVPNGKWRTAGKGV